VILRDLLGDGERVALGNLIGNRVLAHASQQVRCRGHRCSFVARPHYHVARPHVRPYGQPSNAWEYSPLNNPYHYGGAMGEGG
jgi:hypothetical protein